MNQRDLALQALKAALRLRVKFDLGLDTAICLFDLANELQVEVRFVDIPTLEGMYVQTGRPLILVSAHRPPGRRSFTGAHELGHHIFGHGTSVDELAGSERSAKYKNPNELLADSFAGHLLMPKGAIHRALKATNASIEKLDPIQVYGIAQWLGVGYATLISHLEYGLEWLPAELAAALRRVQPKDIRAEIYGSQIGGQIFQVGPVWTGRPVDAEVGDRIVGLKGMSIEGSALALDGESGDGSARLIAVKPGITRIATPDGWSAAVRISRPNFVGRNIFRHLEEPEEDER